ncbi:MAG: hypothetical protein ABDH29_06580 [Aquificaceae bacterium]
MVDADILLLAIVNMAEGVKSLIGDKGAKAVMRDAGKQAGPRLLESLIGHFPENLRKEEALRRACIVLENLGFAQSIKFEEGRIVAEEDVFTDAIVGEGPDEFTSGLLLCGSYRGLCLLYERPEGGSPA